MAVSVPWKTRWKDKIQGADAAVARINSGDTVFIGTGAAQPETLCLELAARAGQVHDVEIYHLLTLGDAPYIGEDKRNSFRVNAFFIAPNARDAVQKGLADYTPIFLSDIPSEFSSGRIALDVALIQTSPPDENGFMTFGVSVDIDNGVILVGAHKDGSGSAYLFDALSGAQLGKLRANDAAPDDLFGVAVALDDGLIVPVVRDADRKGILQISAEISDLASRARSGSLRPDDVSGGTFTISNLGMFGIDRFTAILNPPQAGILAVGQVRRQFVPDEQDQPVVRPLMALRLSADHRVVDGGGDNNGGALAVDREQCHLVSLYFAQGRAVAFPAEHQVFDPDDAHGYFDFVSVGRLLVNVGLANFHLDRDPGLCCPLILCHCRVLLVCCLLCFNYTMEFIYSQ